MIEATIFRVLVLAINLTLGFLVYRRNPRSATHALLAIIAVVIFLWGVSNEISLMTATVTMTLWWIRFTLFFSVPFAILFLLFMHTFPKVSLQLSKKSLFSLMSVMAVVMMLTLSPWVFSHIEEGVGQNAKPVPGPAIFAFVLTITSANLLAVVTLIKKIKNLHGIERMQAWYLALGTGLMLGLLTLLLVLVVTQENTTFVPYQSSFTLPFIALTAYAIARHRLMDIKLAIARSLSLSFLVGAVLAIYGLLLVFAVPVITDFTGLRGEIIAAVAALLSIPIARFVQQSLTRLTDKFLFQRRVDYRQALVKISDQLSGTINIKDVTDTVIQAMKEIVRSKKAIIFLQDPKDKEFVPRALSGVKHFRVTIPGDHVLIQHLRHQPGPLVKDELALAKEQEQKPAHVEELEQIENALTWLDASVILPLFVNKELTGIIALGDKLSGEPYLQDDTNFLAAFAPQAATALENARLYQESLEFGEKLKLEVERATKELAVANEQLRDLDKAKSEFLSIASHQLYTPLTALRGYLSMIKEGDYGKTPPKQRPIIGILEKSADRLITLIKGLLDISRIESGRLELNLESVDLVEMTRELVKDLLPNAAAKKLKLIFEEPDRPLPRVVVDRQRVRQVMLNFIDNAIKYTPAGRVDVTIRHLNDEIIFAVTDTGKGISQTEISKLFNKFTRVGGADRFHTEGTGLGLYVARQIVEEHHGQVEVESPGKDQGSTFSMRLPAAGSPKALKVGQKAEVAIKASG